MTDHTSIINKEPGTIVTHTLPQVDVLFVTLQAAGGGSQPGLEQDGLYMSSGSGGSGASLVHWPVFLQDFTNSTKLNLYSGKATSGGDGESSYAELTDDSGTVLMKYEVSGGKAGGSDTEDVTLPGEGGENAFQSAFNGKSGQFGMCLPPSAGTAFGPPGAASYYGAGGKGSLRFTDTNGTPSLNAEEGTLGSGAGGSSSGSAAAKGGDGFVIIEF